MNAQTQMRPQDRLPDSWENLTVVIEGQDNVEVGRARFSPPVMGTIQSLVTETLIVCIGRQRAVKVTGGRKISFAISSWDENQRVLTVLILPNGIQ